MQPLNETGSACQEIVLKQEADGTPRNLPVACLQSERASKLGRERIFSSIAGSHGLSTMAK